MEQKPSPSHNHYSCQVVNISRHKSLSFRDNFSWQGKKGLWTPFVLDECTCLSKVVNPSFDCGQWIQRMQCANGDRVFIGWEIVIHLCTYNCVGQGFNDMVVGRIECVTLVIPV